MAMVMLCQLMIVMDGKGKREIKEAAKIIFPNKDTIVEYFGYVTNLRKEYSFTLQMFCLLNPQMNVCKLNPKATKVRSF